MEFSNAELQLLQQLVKQELAHLYESDGDVDRIKMCCDLTGKIEMQYKDQVFEDQNFFPWDEKA